MKFKDEIIEDINEEDYLTDSEEEENNNQNERRIMRTQENIIKKFNVNFYFDFNKDKKFVIQINPLSPTRGGLSIISFPY